MKLSMDETGVLYDSSSNYTYDRKVVRDVVVKSHYAVKRKLSVAITLGYAKDKPFMLPPFIIFKSDAKKNSTTVEEINKTIGNDAYCSWSGSGWNTEVTMKSYCSFLVKHLRNFILGKVLLICDGYYSHENRHCVNYLEQNKVDILILPSGCTSILQPLDVNFNKSLKSLLKSSYAKFLAKCPLESVPPHKTIVEWIISACKEIDMDLIYEGFTLCGLIKPLDKDNCCELGRKIKECANDVIAFLKTSELEKFEGLTFDLYIDSTEITYTDLLFSKEAIEYVKEAVKVKKINRF
jgi:hypothetical protein